MFSPVAVDALGLPRAGAGAVPTPARGAGALPGPRPHGLFRLSTATRQVRDVAHGWLHHRAPHDTAHREAEEALLHEAESSALLRPPVQQRAAAMDEELAEIFLSVALHWLEVADFQHDPRYTNAALKLIGCSLLSGRAAGRSQLAATALDAAVHALAGVVVPPLAAPAAAEDLLAPIQEHAGTGNPAPQDRAIAVLAGAGSTGLPLFLDAAHRSGVRIRGVLEHSPAPGGALLDSAYARAWYPGEEPRTQRRTVPEPPAVPSRHLLAHGDWDAAARLLGQWRTGLLVLLGMDIVPSTVLDVPTAATVNAHNGELPAFRGMDAVAWARLAGHHPVCTVHRVEQAVDAGAVLASAAAPLDGGDSRSAVKDTQIALLVRTAAHYAATGSVPVGLRQDHAAARRWYRMHPALRRVLDRNPTHPTHPEEQ
ncbi:formyltransferase family protein [Streptomyces rubiginosohelvolus]|uniref:formyltransferase family protein n=1 Tax=Streptomyces rubiginosohelvolus TaxID=67362 RepID=UPI00379B1BC1